MSNENTYENETKLYGYEHDERQRFKRPPNPLTKLVPLLITVLFIAGGLYVFCAQWQKQNKPSRKPATQITGIQVQKKATVSRAPAVPETAPDAHTSAPEEDVESLPEADVAETMLAQVTKPAEEPVLTEETQVEKTSETERPVPPELQALNGKFQKLCADIEAKHLENIKRLKGAYVKCLVQREKQFQKTGDLHGMLAFQRERERFENDGEFPSFADNSAVASLRKAQEKVIGYLEKVQTTKTQKLTQVRGKHLAQLTALEKELTTKRRIEDAVVVRAERERVEFEGQVMASITMTSNNTRLF
jgi:hypothetical protein